MSDRGPGQIVIYDCPIEKRNELVALLDEFEFSDDFGGAEIEELELFAVYGNDSARLDVHEELGRAVISKVPEASFAAWVDPYYEYDGMILLYTPELGQYNGRCNAAGEPYVTAPEVRAGLIAGDLEKGSGLPWIEQLDAMKEKVPA
jgi:hypothetical protein